MRCRRMTIVVLLLTGLSYAQDVSPSDRETIGQLVQQVKELQEKVKILESQRAPGEPPTPIAAPQEETAQSTNNANGVPPPSVARELHELHGIQWRGFGELDYKVLDQKAPELGTYGFDPGSHGNFYTGDFDLLLTSQINDKTMVITEIVFGEGDAQTFNVDLERMLLKYDYNDHLKISLGRYHTGIGYYNFNSGTWLQTTADRPLIMEFADDGGLLPTQAVGLSITGSLPSGRLGLNYLAEYGSGDTMRPSLRGSTVNDENNSNQINIGLFARPDSIPGFLVGGSIYHDKITDSTPGLQLRLGQTIVNAHVVYGRHGMEFLSEGFLIRHAYELNSTVYNTAAFYSQISKEFGRIRPYFRYQYINANQKGLFKDVALRQGPSFGARYELNDYAAFKAQLDHTLRTGQPDINGLHLQLAFTF